MRLFIALDLPERTADNLERSASQLKQLSIGGRFVAKQNYHLTLHFLGEVAESDVMYVQAAMDEIRNLLAPTLAVLQIAMMRTGDLVYAKIKNAPELITLHEKLGSALENLRFAVEHRAYRPHVTLARKATFSLPFSEVTKNVTVFNAPFCANKVVLYASALGSDGPTYTPLYTITLPTENQ